MFEQFKVIVAGGRDFSDRLLMKNKLDSILSSYKSEDIQIVSGGARGADLCGEGYAQDNNIDYVVFNADWKKHGNKAGILRNKEMGDYADALVAFWDGESRGTKQMIEYAKEKELKLRIIRYAKKDLQDNGIGRKGNQGLSDR